MKNPRINVLCIVGAMVGVSCLLTTWALVTETPPGWPTNTHSKGAGVEPLSWSLVDALASTLDPFSNAYGDAEIVAFSALFIIGTALAFITPLGGAPQLAGVLGFYSSSAGNLFVSEFAAGFAIAALAAVIVLASIAIPLGVGYDARPLSLRARLLTVSGL